LSNLSTSYKRHRFPAEIIGHAVWLFNLGLRDVDAVYLGARHRSILRNLPELGHEIWASDRAWFTSAPASPRWSLASWRGGCET